MPRKLSHNVHDVRKQLTKIGDYTSQKFYENKDVNMANTAIKAFAGAINAARAQIQYKKLTGTPEKIDFLEESK